MYLLLEQELSTILFQFLHGNRIKPQNAHYYYYYKILIVSQSVQEGTENPQEKLASQIIIKNQKVLLFCCACISYIISMVELRREPSAKKEAFPSLEESWLVDKIAKCICDHHHSEPTM